MKNNKNLLLLEFKKLPNEMRKASVLGSVYSFKYLGSPYKLFLDIKRHEEILFGFNCRKRCFFNCCFRLEIISSVVLQK